MEGFPLKTIFYNSLPIFGVSGTVGLGTHLMWFNITGDVIFSNFLGSGVAGLTGIILYDSLKGGNPEQ